MAKKLHSLKTLTLFSVALGCAFHLPSTASSSSLYESSESIDGTSNAHNQLIQERQNIEDLTPFQCSEAESFFKNTHKKDFVCSHSINDSTLTFGRRRCYQALNHISLGRDLEFDQLETVFGFTHLCLTPEFSDLVDNNQNKYMKNVSIICKTLNKIDHKKHVGATSLQVLLTLKFIDPLLEKHHGPHFSDKKRQWLTCLWKRLNTSTSKSRTIPLLKASLILDHKFCPTGMNQDEAKLAGRSFLKLAKTPEKSKGKPNSSPENQGSKLPNITIAYFLVKDMITGLDQILDSSFQSPQTIQQTSQQERSDEDLSPETGVAGEFEGNEAHISPVDMDWEYEYGAKENSTPNHQAEPMDYYETSIEIGDQVLEAGPSTSTSEKDASDVLEDIPDSDESASDKIIWNPESIDILKKLHEKHRTNNHLNIPQSLFKTIQKEFFKMTGLQGTSKAIECASRRFNIVESFALRKDRFTTEIRTVLSNLYPNKVLPLRYSNEVQKHLETRGVYMEIKQITNFIINNCGDFQRRKKSFYSKPEKSRAIELFQQNFSIKDITSCLNQEFHNGNNIRSISGVRKIILREMKKSDQRSSIRPSL